ncbi:accessory factor UbiK family protein [Pyruvatibacter mobilis]|jgi:BMFP domain-containing protein YqiC|uniref:accessory factor UbiK family protein n=1 Tax=Pyruvatibacter mobilis TaxID=1712261 RepID=UPI00040D610E
MTQYENRFLDDVAKLMTSAAGAAQGMRSEVETVIRSQAERLVADLDLVPREDFEAMRELAVAARTEAEELKERLEALEARVAKLETGA